MGKRKSDKRIPVVHDTKKDNYLTFGLNNVSLGAASGAYGTGSICLTDFLMNGTSGIAGGTAVNQRLGNKLYFTTLKMRLRANISPLNSVRVIIGKTVDPLIAKSATNTVATAAIESTIVLEPVLQGGTATFVDYPLSNTLDVKILHDKVYIQTTGAQSSIDINTDLWLALQRGYDNSSNVLVGSYFIYLVASAATNLYGYVKVGFSDQTVK